MTNAGDVAGVSSSAPAATTPSGRAPRLPRWTRQEILVLIEGKRMVEGRGGRGGRGRAGGGGGGEATVEPKWAAVAEYCRRHGVERGPVQCRKRWSNLAGDYKKIREWEGSAAAGREASFWAMRNDARRERRLPGFFDREVYDILDGRGRALAGQGGNAAGKGEEAAVARVEAEGKEKEAAVEEAVFDSGRPAGEDTLFSEDEEEEDEEEAPAPAPAPASAPASAVVAVPISEKKSEASRQESSDQGTSKDKQPEQSTEKDLPTASGQKRQRIDDESGEGTNLQSKLIEILDRNSRMVAAQLEAQNMNCQLDREQRKDQANSLLGVLGKLADALGRIADKL